MRYAKRFVIFLFALFLLLSTYVVSVSAQGRRTVRVPVVIRNYVYRDPFWYSRNSWFDIDPYWSDPFLREQRERYYLEDAVRDAQTKLAKDTEKFLEDGYITAKEREKMIKNHEKYAKAVRKLDELYRDN